MKAVLKKIKMYRHVLDVTMRYSSLQAYILCIYNNMITSKLQVSESSSYRVAASFIKKSKSFFFIGTLETH